MNIKVIEDDIMSKMSEPVGECAVCNLEITVDKSLNIKQKQRLVIHAVIENYFRDLCHDKVDEVEDYIVEALEQLEGV
uniref:Uncharacterized protein n=1 Tax=viral metagenome TaxID=1070528 RepID=A0A6M3LB74_9ZZZZ